MNLEKRERIENELNKRFYYQDRRTEKKLVQVKQTANITAFLWVPGYQYHLKQILPFKVS